jgi:hypothetical protein
VTLVFGLCYEWILLLVDLTSKLPGVDVPGPASSKAWR